MGSFFLTVTGAAHCFAIDRDSLAAGEVLIGEPAANFQVEVIGIQALEGASEGGFGGRVFACTAQGFEGVAGEFLSPLCDGLETSSTREARTGGHGDDGDDGVTYAAGFSGVSDGFEQIYEAALFFEGQTVDIDHRGFLLVVLEQG